LSKVENIRGKGRGGSLKNLRKLFSLCGVKLTGLWFTLGSNGGLRNRGVGKGKKQKEKVVKSPVFV